MLSQQAMDIKTLIEAHQGKQHDIFAQTVNPQLVKVLRTIGFDINYVRAEGQYLYNDKGEKYLDFLAGYGVFNIGRGHPKIKAALHQAIDADWPSMVQMDAPLASGILAEELIARLPQGLDTIFFVNSGTEANEGAIKFARRATGKPRLLYLNHAFHGLSTGSLSMNGGEEFKIGFGPLLPATGVELNDLRGLELELKKEDVCAFFVEPIQGKGVHVPDPNYFPAAQELCRKYGALFVVDEVKTGFGRSGRFFCLEHWGLKPDIVTMAKALSGGYIPTGAIAYSKEIYKKVFRNMEDCVVHSNTFARNNLAAVAGLAILRVIDEEHIVANAEQKGQMLMDGLNKLKEKFEFIKDVRGKGLMIGIEFGKPQSMKLKAGWNFIKTLNKNLFAQMVIVPLLTEHKILTQISGHNTNTINLLPPLTITDEDVQWFLNSF
ncbi:aspartate aminotransferase family protein, partial [bacterium]|nr:aspartate aminotransferase family protein [bacterium]